LQLPNDLENFIYFQHSKGDGRHPLKNNILPHIFACHDNKSESVIRESSIRRAQKRVSEELLDQSVNEYDDSPGTYFLYDLPISGNNLLF